MLKYSEHLSNYIVTPKIYINNKLKPFRTLKCSKHAKNTQNTLETTQKHIKITNLNIANVLKLEH